MGSSPTVTIDTGLAELIAQQPGSLRVLELFDIDYCRVEDTSLVEACDAKGVDAATVLKLALAEPTQRPVCDRTCGAGAGLAELADNIEQIHHAYFKRELPRLSAMVRKVAAVHGSHYPWLLEVDGVFAGFAAEMASHMMKEEQLLLPLIRCLESGVSDAGSVCGPGLIEPILVMQHEHEDACQSLRRMRRLSHDFLLPPGGCDTFRAMLSGLSALETEARQHRYAAEELLFPLALACESGAKERGAEAGGCVGSGHG